MWIRSGLVAGLMVLATAVGADAAIIYNSLTTASNLGSTINTYSVANSFTAIGSTLTEVEIALEKANSLGGNGSVVITLNADNGLSGPGSVLYILDTISDAWLPNSGTKYMIDLNNMGIVTLNPGTKYWIEVAKNGSNSTAIKDYTTSSAPTTGSGEYATKLVSGAFVVNTIPPEMALCISDDNSCTLIGLGWSRRKARRNAPV
jgi:hypothetical protein